jgi:GNAT superfamily N-acetyltransferase
MSSGIIVEPLVPSHPLWSDLPTLFRRMYDDMGRHGLRLPLAVDGEALWVKNVAFGVGKYAIVVGARHDDRLIGFAHGTLKSIPDYLGAQRVGFVSHIYVAPEHRRGGTARGLYRAMDDWFRDRGVKSIELQVLVDNEAAIRFWTSLGYAPELVQLRKG